MGLGGYRTIQFSGDNREKKKISVKKLAPLFIVLAVLAAILAWCGIFHFRAKMEFERENYDSAETYIKLDFIFGSELKKQIRQTAGEACFAQERYDEAASWFLTLGAEGHSRWSDAVYQAALENINQGDPDTAIQKLNEIGEETRAQQQIGVAQLAVAQEQLELGDFDAALNTAKEIRNTDLVDIDAFNAQVHFRWGLVYMDDENYYGALSEFENGAGVPVAEADASILRTLIDKDYYSAAVQLLDAQETVTADISMSKWKTAFTFFLKSARSDLEKLNASATESLLKGSFEFSEAFQDKLNSLSMIGKKIDAIPEGDSLININPDDFSDCGQEPNGKILIVQKQRAFSSDINYYYIPLDMMEYIPPEYYPAGPNEVQYVVLLTYTHSNYGTYSAGTTALTLRGQVDVYEMPSAKRVYHSAALTGSAPPDTIFFYSGDPPKWYAGDPPAMGKALFDAIKSVM